MPCVVLVSTAWSLFFFFQAEDGIRDSSVWSSDVCSSDLERSSSGRPATLASRAASFSRSTSYRPARPMARLQPSCSDRKSVVEGKSVDLGGRRIIKKKKQQSGAVVLWSI